MNIFDIDFIMLRFPGYNLSLVEFLGTLSGMLCVIYAARERVVSWPLGIVNAVLFFLLFYQARLYPDMFLQVYYLVTSVYGWFRWTHPRHELETDSKDELKVSVISSSHFIVIMAVTLGLSILAGAGAQRIHLWMPALFPGPSSFPYADSFVAVFSVAAQVLLTLKKNEAWLLWVMVDSAAAVIYFMKGIYLVGAEYVVFGLIAAAGLWNWRRIMVNYGREAVQ